MFNPVATYRIQFNKGFNFTDLERIIPYLVKLGINTIYASPIFESMPGSTHGYDGLNPLKINPEIGTIAQLRRISKKLKTKGISWLQDIVPNHMAFHPNNLWLMDVLEKGPESAYKTYFDQSLSDELFKGPIMVPFLGSDLDTVIDNAELKIELINGKLVFNYAGSYWPLNAASYPDNRTPLTKINKDKTLLKKIAGDQYYRLCCWEETDHRINFRRFFTVNGLICLNIQNDEVFDHFHQLIDTFLKEDVFQGLRIDHIDGLYDPTKYIEQLRRLTGNETYIIVEKILKKGEDMPAWPLQGNTGYDFLAVVNNLFTNQDSERVFHEFYQHLSKNTIPVAEQIRRKKAYILTKQMAGELDNLTMLLLGSDIIAADDLKQVSPDRIKNTVAEFLICCPVYRYYGNSFPLGDEESQAIKKIFKAIENNKPQLKNGVDLLKSIFINKTENEKALHFYQRCMQFTGPLMAKGVEDTLMYTYNRFIAHNEVGDAPDAFGLGTKDYHRAMQERQKLWPLTMNGTATHDTKRGEDARARLNVLTDIPEEWLQTVKLWQDINKDLIKKAATDGNDEYFIYETIIGTYPMPGESDDNYSERLEQYLEKTIREAKLHSGWAQPNENYEADTKQFAKGLLNKKGKFWKSFKSFHQKVSGFGVVNSLAQVLLKFTSPGMPDTYQGCELWDLSMVDPDNRRPVDYELRSAYLNDLPATGINDLWQHKFNGQIKLWLTNALLHERKANPLAFTEGDYIPVTVEGKFKSNVLAFARRFKNTWYIIAVPLNIALVCTDAMKMNWEDTRLILPEKIPGEFENLLLKTKGKTGKEINISLLFIELPLAFLKLQMPENNRGAGILMHITSLPSAFAIGDFGPGARAFADLLHASYQKYWQLLPLSSVDEKNQFSPYSASSGMAGNFLLISPELLMEDGLLNTDDLANYVEPATNKTDYKTAAWLKELIFEKAWQNFNREDSNALKTAFNKFCKAEAYWLNDYALYSTLKMQHNNKPWHQWPKPYKQRDKKALSTFEKKNITTIEKSKWLQFIFMRQWLQLKSYCNKLDIKLFGDLPFYVSYDSVDVWAHPEIFSLDNDGTMKLVAGVPPDYFNANGQLWGMPVFNWNKLKAQKYNWWVQRIGKNMELYNLLRLDHFRAFSSYWSVPASEETAINGTWNKGPGKDLLSRLQKKFGALPFVAEDLGDIDPTVYKLRDELGFPGMKVLQFAFGEDMARSPHIPHNHTENHVVYTGTHDNNTTLGWYRQNIDKATKTNITNYTGIKTKKKNIADTLINMALSSTAKICIIPMQDVLCLDESQRMNMPAGTDGNWQWRVTVDELGLFPLKRLRRLVEGFNRR